jgi:hypothetical protein
MRRQLRAQGGIMNVAPREKFGLGSKLKERFRKLIPNEIADVAVKAAPFVAPFNPGIAGLMRGIGRFDQRGSISDALKQGLATTAFGAGTRYLGGAENIMGGGLRGGFTNPIGQDSSLRNLFAEKDTVLTKDQIKEQAKKKASGNRFMDDIIGQTTGKIPGVKSLPQIVQEKLLVGGVTGAATYIYEQFINSYPDPEPGQDMTQYLEERRQRVGAQMRTYMDNYFANDPEYMKLDDAGRNEFVSRYNVRDGGRIGYQTGGISMANTLQQNIERNRQQATGIQSMLNAARKKAGLPTIQAAPSANPFKMLDPKITNLNQLPSRPPKTMVPPETINFLQDADGNRLPDSPNMPIRPMPTGPIQAPTGPVQPLESSDVSDPAREAYDKLQADVREQRKINPYTKDVKYGENMTFEDFKKSYDAGTDPNQPTYSGPQLKQTLPGAEPITNLPESRAPGTEDIMSGYDDFISETYGDGPFISTADVRSYRLPDGTIQQGSSTSMGRLNAYLKSIGQPPVTDVNTFSGDDLQQVQPRFGLVQPGEPGAGTNLPDAEPITNLPGYNKYDLGGLRMSGGMSGGKFTDLQRPREPMMDPNFQNLSPQEQDAAMEKFRKGTDAYIKRFGSFADGREIDPMQGRSSYRDILNAIQTDHPDIYKTLKGDETLAELDQKMLDLQNRKGAAKGGIMSMPMGQPRVNQGGVTELDYRAKGGFVPVGIKEKADDVPAMLSKNEFVFTADAVRGAGNGSVEKGAQKMYNTMKNLERRVT